MKLSTLARRLAEKTGTPILEKVVLGEEPIEALPSDCMPWEGAVDGIRDPRLALRRTYSGEVYSEKRLDRPSPVIKFQGKKLRVVRLIFQLIQKPDYEYRLIRTCEDHPRCVNPLHYSVQRIGTPEQGPEVEEPTISSDWLQIDVDELLEFLFLEASPTSLEEVMAHPFMEEGPPIEMVRDGLINMNKEHLL